MGDEINEEYDIKRVAFAYENIELFYDKSSQDTNKKISLKFLEQILINGGNYEAKYSYAKYTNYGRKYSYGIQSVKRNIRDFLLTGSGVCDYDIKSAHPTILYFLCKTHNIHTENNLLKDYVLNKDAVIEKHFPAEIEAGKDVKKLILTATNSDDILFTKNQWIKDYQSEMVVIREGLKKLKIYKKILQDTEKIKQDTNNQNSSFVNRILCKVESEIIDKFASFTGTETDSQSVFALMFDGILVKNGSDELLDNYNYFVKKTYGEYFNIVNKKIETTIDMGGYVYNAQDVLGSIDSRETCLAVFVEKFKPIKIINPALYGIIQKDGTYEFYKKDAFIQSVEHIRFTNERGAITPAVNEWLRDGITKNDVFSQIITDPEYEGTEMYNLWRQWDILNWEGEWTDDAKAVEYMRKHIVVLCGDDEKVAESIELWVSHMLKYPKCKSFVPIFIGRQGAGKDMFFAWIEMMIGEKKKFETSTPEKHIWGSFNPFMKSAFLIHLSEFGKKNTQDYVGQIKAITTTGKICINEKNKGEYVIDSYHRFVGASNFAEPIPIEGDNRRYLLIHTSPEKIGDTEYFNEGWSYKDDKNAIKSMYNYFMGLNPDEKLQYHQIETSEYMKYIKDISKSQEQCWLEKYVNEYITDRRGKTDRITTTDLYEHYLQWQSATRQPFKFEKRKFLIQIKVAIGNTTKHIKYYKSAGVMVFAFEWDAIKTEDKIPIFDSGFDGIAIENTNDIEIVTDIT